MALVVEDRVKETTLSTGTGALTLAGAVNGFRQFSSVCAIGDTAYVVIVAVDPSGNEIGAWETGLYTYSAADTLTRTTVHSSSSNDLAVPFAAGLKHVFIDFTATQIKQMGVVNSNSGTAPFGLDAALFTSLKFQDEFDGSVLDTTKWDTKLWYEAAPATTNFSVDGGCLNIWPQQDANGAFFSRNIPCKFYQIYGYYEIEIKLPTGAGIQPACWLFSHDLDFEKPTIDVMKSFGASPWTDSLARFQDCRSVVYSMTGVEVGDRRLAALRGAQQLSTAFHKYGVLWEPDGFTFYNDGVALGAKIPSTVNTNRMYPILSLTMGAASSLSGAPSVAGTPQGSANAMQVNYVRIWQLANAPAGSDNPPAATVPGGGVVTPPPPGGGSGTGPVGQDASLWEMTFEDHFEGTTLDRAKWNIGPYYEDITPGTYKIENSNLVMCYQDPFKRGNCTIDTDPNGRNVQGPGFEQLYGFFEVSAKLPYGQNVFPAFWLFRHDQREFDVMECFAGDGATWVTDDFHPINAAWTVHRSLTDTRLGSAALHNNWYLANNGAGQLPGSFPYGWLGCNVVDLSAAHHAYGCEWGPGFIRFLLDGKVIKTQTGGGDPFTTRMTEFDGFPMYMMLDFWMQGSGPGSCPRGFGPWEMRVDYCRAWRRR